MKVKEIIAKIDYDTTSYIDIYDTYNKFMLSIGEDYNLGSDYDEAYVRELEIYKIRLSEDNQIELIVKTT